MEIREFYKPLRKFWWFILAVTVIAGGAGFWTVQQQVPVYSSRATLQIGQSILDDPNPSTGVIWVAQQLGLTYANIANRPGVRNATMEALGLSNLPSYSIRTVANTQLLEITVTDTDPARAQAVANELASQIIKQSPTDEEQDEFERQAFINQQLDSLETKIVTKQEEIDEKQAELIDLFSARQIAEAEADLLTLQGELSALQISYANLLSNSKRGAVNTLRVVEEAPLPTSPITPDNQIIALITAAIGFIISSSIAFAIEFLDDTIKTPDDIDQIAGYPTLAGIARIKVDEDGQGKLITLDHPRSPISEAFRVLRTGIQFSAIDSPERAVLLVTSANPTEGKSLTIANLGVVIAQAGRNVLIVDCDLRRPTQHKVFGLNRNNGLTKFLLEYRLSADDDETLALLQRTIQPTSVAGLQVLTSGPIPPNPSELLGSTKMQSALDLLASQYDYILLDSPPALAVTDSVILSRIVDGVLVVIDAGKTKRVQLKQIVEKLEDAKAHVIGTTLNRLTPRSDGYYYYYYYRSGYYLDEEVGKEVRRRRSSPANGNGNGQSNGRMFGFLGRKRKPASDYGRIRKEKPKSEKPEARKEASTPREREIEE